MYFYVTLVILTSIGPVASNKKADKVEGGWVVNSELIANSPDDARAKAIKFWESQEDILVWDVTDVNLVHVG